jgi:ribosomal protein L13
MATLRERLEKAEAQLAFLAGAGLGGAVGRTGVRRTASAAARTVALTPAGRAALAGASYAALRAELNARDREIAEEEFGSTFASGIGVAQRLQPLPLPLGQAAVFGEEVAKKARKKTVSKFNKAVSMGMKAVKNSKSYGKKGTINNAKKAFSAVTKVASKLNKGKKVSPKGPTGVIKRAISRFFPKKKPVRRTQNKKINITVNK